MFELMTLDMVDAAIVDLSDFYFYRIGFADIVAASRTSSSEEKESTRWLIKYNTSQLFNQLIGSTISINV